MLDVGFVQVGAVLVYALGAALFAEVIGLALVKLGLVAYISVNGAPPAPWSWFRVFVHTALVYAFWWLLTYGPVQVGQ